MLFVSEYLLLATAFALILDAAIGDPPQLYQRILHPVTILGKLIDGLERYFFRTNGTADDMIRRGQLVVILLVFASFLVGMIIQWLCMQLHFGWALLGIMMSPLLAQRSLANHVEAVGDGLDQGLDDGREAVSHIVGRDPNQLDEQGVARAAIESLAENFSDGVVAPVFWGLLFGLPGMLVYKAINTADSMIGYKSERYLYFGRAAAKLDDVVNWVPARISGLLISAAARLMPDARFGRSLQTMARDAGHHRSPNAGWPEAAMAGALDIRLSGPRSYNGTMTEDRWIGDGKIELASNDIERAVRLFWWSCGVLLVLILVFLMMLT